MSPTVIVAAIFAAASFGLGFTGGLKWRDADIAECKADVTARDHALEIQGGAVKRLAEDGAAAQERAKKAQEAAAKANAKAEAVEAPRRAAIAAGTGPATCLDAVAGWAK